MISALDTSVILDVLRGEPPFGPLSLAAMHAASHDGQLIICTAVWAEVRAAFSDPDATARFFSRIGAELVADDEATANLAGAAWRTYRQAGGTRQRVLTDFLIGAHAVLKSDRLVTRDRGFFRSHFSGLNVLDPATLSNG